MRKLVLIIIVLSINLSFSQQELSQLKPWSVTLIGGAFMPIGNQEYKRTADMGADISYKYYPSVSIYLNITYNFLENSHFYYNYQVPEYGLLEATMGTRIYLNPNIDNTFLELGFGYYQKFSHTETGYSSNNNPDEFGINAGVGYDIISDPIITVPIKVKIHYVNFLGGDNIFYWGIYTGVKYSF